MKSSIPALIVVCGYPVQTRNKFAASLAKSTGYELKYEIDDPGTLEHAVKTVDHEKTETLIVVVDEAKVVKHKNMFWIFVAAYPNEEAPKGVNLRLEGDAGTLSEVAQILF